MDKEEKRQAQDRIRSRLLQARERSGLTQTQAAKAIGKHQPYISKREAGDRDIAAVELEELAKIYGVPITFFFDSQD